MIFPIKRLADLGFTLVATEGTAQVLRRNGIASTVVRKLSEGTSEDGELTIVGRIAAGEIAMVVNTPSGDQARADGYEIRAAATSVGSPIITTIQELSAAVQAIEATLDAERHGEGLRVASLQEHTARLVGAWEGFRA